jgi:membrane protein
VIVGVAVLGLATRDAAARETVMDAVLKVIPLSGDGATQLRQLLSSVGGSTSALGLLGLVGLVWSASGIMTAVRTALNIAWDTDERRPFVRGKALDLALVGAVLILITVTFAATIVSGFVHRGSQHLPAALAVFAGPTSRAFSVLLALVVLSATFTLLYRVVPAVPTRISEVWPGAVVAAVGFEALQYAFSIYLTHFADYNRVYGTLGALIGLLFFTYLASSVFLLGAEIASEYPRLLAEQARPG